MIEYSMPTKYLPKLKKEPTRPDHKFCVKCSIEKHFIEFKVGPGRFGLHSWCNICVSEYQKQRRPTDHHHQPVRLKKEPIQPPKPQPRPEKPLIPEGYKRCRKCKQVKEVIADNFQRDARAKGGFHARCKECTTANYYDKKVYVEFDKRSNAGRIALGLPLRREIKPKPTHKLCKKCNTDYPVEEFKTLNGKRGFVHCASCRAKTAYQKTGKPSGRVSQIQIGQMFECKKCRISKPFTIEFFSKDPTKCHGLQYRCRECKIQYSFEYNRLHPEKRTKYNPVTRKAWRERRKDEPVFKLKRNINRLISQGLRANGHRKNSRTAEILGCSLEEFKIHLESLFEPGMTWDNYGKGLDKWNVDHHYPQSAAKTEEEVLKLNHYTNLRPMWESKNKEKHDHIPDDGWNPLLSPIGIICHK